MYCQSIGVCLPTLNSCTRNNPLNHYDVADTLPYLLPVNTVANIWAPREYMHHKDEIMVQNSYYTFMLSIGRPEAPHWS